MVGYGGKDLQKRKVLSLEWKSEGVMDDESGESMEPMEECRNAAVSKSIAVYSLLSVACLRSAAAMFAPLTASANSCTQARGKLHC